EDARHRIAVADLHRVERGLAGLGEIRAAAEAEPSAAAALRVRRPEGRLGFCRALELPFLDEAQRLGPDRGLLGSARAADHARGLGIVGVFLRLAERHERAALAARVGHHALLLRPVARDVQLAVREPQRPLALADLDGRLDLAVAVEARAVVEDHRADIAR